MSIRIIDKQSEEGKAFMKKMDDFENNFKENSKKLYDEMLIDNMIYSEVKDALKVLDGISVRPMCPSEAKKDSINRCIEIAKKKKKVIAAEIFTTVLKFITKK